MRQPAVRRAPGLPGRLRLIGVGGALGILAIAFQLVSLQIVAGPEMAALSEKNRVRLRPVTAPRGILYDRHGLPLVENRPAFTLVVTPRDAEDLPAVVDRLTAVLRLPAGEFRDRLARVAAEAEVLQVFDAADMGPPGAG